MARLVNYLRFYAIVTSRKASGTRREEQPSSKVRASWHRHIAGRKYAQSSLRNHLKSRPTGLGRLFQEGYF